MLMLIMMINIVKKYLSRTKLHIMMFYPTVGSTYFVKTQTYVALFGPHQLSTILPGVMHPELSPLQTTTSPENGKTTRFQVSLKISSNLILSIFVLQSQQLFILNIV